MPDSAQAPVGKKPIEHERLAKRPKGSFSTAATPPSSERSEEINWPAAPPLLCDRDLVVVLVRGATENCLTGSPLRRFTITAYENSGLDVGVLTYGDRVGSCVSVDRKGRAMPMTSIIDVLAEIIHRFSLYKAGKTPAWVRCATREGTRCGSAPANVLSAVR